MTKTSESNVWTRIGWCMAVALIAPFVFVVVASVLAWNYFALQDTIRWAVWSDVYRSEVLAQPPSQDGQLKHIEWDASGFAGITTFNFLVFDPDDAVERAARRGLPRKLPGIPCDAVGMRRLDEHWYTVEFYANEYWGQCGP